MANYLFKNISWNKNCGMRLFIESSTKERADEVLNRLFFGDRFTYLGKYTDEEADMEEVSLRVKVTESHST